MNSVAPDGGYVVVTGASTGIGRLSALRLDEMGFRVLAGVRRRADAESLAAEASGRLTPVHLDVTRTEDVLRAAEHVREAVGDGGLWGLVNNAGVVFSGPLEFLPIEYLRRQFEVNLFGQVAVTQVLLPLLRAGRGRVVNIGSISGRCSLPFQAPYAASKHALEAVTDALRLEVRPFGIRVSIIEPSSVSTPIWDKSIKRGEDVAEGFPAECDSLYGGCLAGLRDLAGEAADNAIDPERVVSRVVHALTARRPKSRYLVGFGARQLWLLERLPVRLRDWLIWREIARKSG